MEEVGEQQESVLATTQFSITERGTWYRVGTRYIYQVESRAWGYIKLFSNHLIYREKFHRNLNNLIGYRRSANIRY